MAQNAFAHGNLDQTTAACPCFTTANFNAGNGVFDVPNRYQEFVPTQINIVSIDIVLRPAVIASANPITVTLHDGGPTGPIIGITTTHTGLPPINVEGDVHFDFAGPIALIPGNLYTIELAINDGSSNLPYKGDITNSYPSGDSWRRDGSNTLLGPFTNLDLTLKTYAQSQASQGVGGEIIPIETTSLLLAGAQSFSWMIPVVLSGIGIGLFVVSRKSE